MLIFLMTMFAIMQICFAANSTINVLFVSEDSNIYAEFTFRAAVNFVMENQNIAVNYKLVKGSNKRTELFFSNLCTAYEAMLDAATPPDIVLDTTISGEISESVKSFSAALGLPTISTSVGQPHDLQLWSNISQIEQKYLIQILPPVDVIPEIVRQIVIKQNYSTAAIITDESYIMQHKYKHLLENLATRHIIADLFMENPIKQLIAIRKQKIFNIFVIANSTNAQAVLEDADAVGMFTKEFAWHAITHDASVVKCECKKADVIFARPVVQTVFELNFRQKKRAYQFSGVSDVSTGFYFDMAVRSFLAAETIHNNLFKPNMLKCEDYNGTNSIRNDVDLNAILMNHGAYTPTSGQINITTNGMSSINFDMNVSVLEFRDGSLVESKALGTWKAGFYNDIAYVTPDLMKLYASTTYYRVVAYIQKPFLFEDPTAPKKFAGYCIDLLDDIARLVNFDYEIAPAFDGLSGNRNAEGDWNGVIRELIERRGDIGLGAISVTEERQEFVDFTVPIFDMVGQTILMKYPEKQTYIFRFLSIFDGSVWLCLALFYFFTSFLIWFFATVSPFGYAKLSNTHVRRFTFGECLWFCLISFTPQGAGEAPVNLSARLLAGFWWFFAFIIFSSYSANLSAFLTVSRLDTPIKSLDDLSMQYTMEYAPLNGSTTMEYFMKMVDIEKMLYEKWLQMSLNRNQSDWDRAQLAVWEYPLSDKYTKLWKNMQRYGLPQTLEEALDRVRASTSSSDGFAFLGDAITIKYAVLISCDFQIIGKEFHRKSFAVAVQQGSPLRDKFNTAILELLNRRQLETLKEKWWTSNPERILCSQRIDSGGIGMENIAGIFIFLGVAVFGLICFTISKYCWKKLNIRKRVSSMHQ